MKIKDLIKRLEEEENPDREVVLGAWDEKREVEPVCYFELHPRCSPYSNTTNLFVLAPRIKIEPILKK